MFHSDIEKNRAKKNNFFIEVEGEYGPIKKTLYIPCGHYFPDKIRSRIRDEVRMQLAAYADEANQKKEFAQRILDDFNKQGSSYKVKSIKIYRHDQYGNQSEYWMPSIPRDMSDM